jgi:hypothetical protein
MIPGVNLTAFQKLTIVVDTYRICIVEVNINDGAALYICVQGVHDRLEGCAMGVELENRVDVQIFIDIDGTTDVLDEVTAFTTVVVSSLTEDGIGVSGEAVEVEVPEVVLVDVDFIEGVCSCGAVCGEMLCEVFSEEIFYFSEFHNNVPFIINRLLSEG